MQSLLANAILNVQVTEYHNIMLELEVVRVKVNYTIPFVTVFALIILPSGNSLHHGVYP